MKFATSWIKFAQRLKNTLPDAVLLYRKWKRCKGIAVCRRDAFNFRFLTVSPQNPETVTPGTFCRTAAKLICLYSPIVSECRNRNRWYTFSGSGKDSVPDENIF